MNGSAGGAFRVLWLGPDRGELPTPAGDPRRRLEAGPATIRYALTDRDGASVLDAGRPLSGPGPDDLDRMLDEILGATTRHGVRSSRRSGSGMSSRSEGRCCRPRSTRSTRRSTSTWLPDGPHDLPERRGDRARRLLETQPADEEIIASADPSAIARWRPVPAVPLREVPGGWDGPAADGTVFLSTEHDDDWTLEGSTEPPDVAFGWATSFLATGGPSRCATGAPSREDRGGALDRVVARRAVGDEEAGGLVRAGRARSARGQALVALGTVLVVIVALVWLDRDRTQVARTASRTPSGAWLCPHGGASGTSVSLYLGNPGTSTVQARVTRLGTEAPGPAESVEVPAGSTVRVDSAAEDRGASTYVEFFGGWLGAGWVASTEDGIAAEPCAADAARHWYLPDGSTQLGRSRSS